MVSQTENGLQVSMEEGAAWSRKLVITVPADRVRSARARVSKRLAKRVRIPGFRKGKVPTHIMESRYAQDIDRQTQQTLIDDAFQEAVRTNDLEPIGEPVVASVDYDPGAELTFEVRFDIKPQINLTRLGGFRVKRPGVELQDSEIDKQIEHIRRQAALWKPVDRHPESGDNVEVEITNLEGEDRETRPYRFVLGEGRAIPGVETAIMRLKPGESDEFSVAFPEDFPEEEKRGLEQQLRIELKSVFEEELPEIDDEFARSVGEFEDLASLREAVSTDLLKGKQREAETQVERQIIEQIIESNTFEVPETMVKRYLNAILGAPPEGADPEAVRAAQDGARPAAIWGIKRTLILQKIAESQGFDASAEEVGERVEAIAKRAGRPVSEVRAHLVKSGDLKDLERQLIDEKVLNFLKEQSQIESGEA